MIKAFNSFCRRRFHHLIQIFINRTENTVKGIQLVRINRLKQFLKKYSLDFVSPFDERGCFFRAGKIGFPAVAGNGSSFDVAFMDQLIDINGYQIGFNSADFYDIPGCVVCRVIGKEHQDIKGRLRQFYLLAERAAVGGISLEQFVRELKIHLHHVFPPCSKKNSSKMN